MHLHILGIGGTFMSALAILAREAGHTVTGCDANCYPPVSDLLAAKDIAWTEGYTVTPDALKADWVIVGNAIKRGMPVLEAVLDGGKNYTSGPQWLAEHILPRYRVLAVAGTHGKTTTTSMLAWIFAQAGFHPGFLIGGVAPNFNTSAQLGDGDWFIIEADEYDSAFFDKRPKLMHYRPEVALINNLEFDHADIYADLAAIQQQFHYYLKTIPAKGIVIKPQHDQALNQVIGKGIYSRLETTTLEENADWRAELLDESGRHFRVWHQQQVVAEVNWPLIGRFNVENGLSAIAASYHAGIAPHVAADALSGFIPVKRRLEVKSNAHDITVYDDFAHHPTAIAKTIQALRQSKRHERIVVILEFASNTMKSGLHGNAIGDALADADRAFLLQPEQFNLSELAKNWQCEYEIFPSTEQIVQAAIEQTKPGDAILVMSNRSFNNIHAALIAGIKTHWA